MSGTQQTAAQIIARKRNAHELTPDQIRDFISGFTDGGIPEYQMAALAMAIHCRGMTADETTALTDVMLRSGATLDWPHDGRCRVDKHSTGGIGDKVSLILAPLMACCGLQVPMLSGRGLGATGGTLDKLEAIPGFRTDLSVREIEQLTMQVGCVITGASAELAPADRKLYALRDVTATVPSIPLITASIMSKKLAESLDALVLDVKFGSGAFMKTRTDARQLAESLVQTGQRMNVRTTALLTDMNQPLGRMIGNAVEVHEAIDTLTGHGPDDLRDLTLALGCRLLTSTGSADSETDATVMLADHLSSGRALERFHEMVSAQGGDLTATIPVAPATIIESEQSGHVSAVDAEQLGIAVIHMGGGRRVMSDRIDHSVGMEILVRVGDRVESGQPLFRVFTPDARRFTDRIRQTIEVSDVPAAPLNLICEQIGCTEIRSGRTSHPPG